MAIEVDADMLDTLDVDFEMAVEEGDAEKQKELFDGLLEAAKDLKSELDDAREEISNLESDVYDARSEADEFDGSYHSMRDAMLKNYPGSLGERIILEDMFREFETKVGMNHYN